MTVLRPWLSTWPALAVLHAFAQSPESADAVPIDAIAEAVVHDDECFGGDCSVSALQHRRLRGFDIALNQQGTCSNMVLSIVESKFNVSGPLQLAQYGIDQLKQSCASGKCPRVSVDGCFNQSANDFRCSIPEIIKANITDASGSVCKTACNPWPCKAGCRGIDVGICKGSQYILCDAGCLGIGRCRRACNKRLVDPCMEKLVNQCNDKCVTSFGKCFDHCQSNLELQLNLTLNRLSGAVDSLELLSLDINCTGDALINPMELNATALLNFTDFDLGFEVFSKDAGVTSHDQLDLNHSYLSLEVPFTGSIFCGGPQNVTLDIGNVTVRKFDTVVKAEFQDTFKKVAHGICLGIGKCIVALNQKIDRDIHDALVNWAPGGAGPPLASVLQELANRVECPSL